MPFVASIKYIPNLSPTSFQIQDTSPYAAPDSKSNFSARTLTILDSVGAALPNYPNPINFPYGSDLFTISGMVQDLALKITMVLTPITPVGGSIYTAEADVATERFLQQGLFNIQVQRLNTLTPSSLSDQQYRTNSIDLIIEGQNADTGVLYSNFVGAQDALNRAQNIINNTTL